MIKCQVVLRAYCISIRRVEDLLPQYYLKDPFLIDVWILSCDAIVLAEVTPTGLRESTVRTAGEKAGYCILAWPDLLRHLRHNVYVVSPEASTWIGLILNSDHRTVSLHVVTSPSLSCVEDAIIR